MTILLLAVSKQLSSSQQAIFQIKQTTDTNNKQQTKFGHFELLSAVKNETTCNEMQYFIYYINIPYGQSSAKLPVIQSFGLFRSFRSFRSFGSFGSFGSFKSSCHLVSCHLNIVTDEQTTGMFRRQIQYNIYIFFSFFSYKREINVDSIQITHSMC